MAILPLPIARVSDQLRNSVALSSIAKTQSDILTVQNQIATGQRISTPSDDPAAAAGILQLQKTLARRTAYTTNLQSATSQLGAVDSTLSDLTGVIQQAQTIASQNVGSDVSADQRKAAAALVDNLIGQAVSIGNKQFNGVYLFAGDRSTDAPFVNGKGGVQFVGSPNVLQNNFDESSRLPFTVDGERVFGALTTQVSGAANLAPALGADTRLADLGGAANNGVATGTIRVGNGVTTADVDLSNAGTVGDVVNAINAAGLAGVTASLGTRGLQIAGGANISVNETSGGSTAADLGILTPTGAGAGASINGGSLGAKVTPLTKLPQLNGGAGIDPAGITIANGPITVHLNFGGDTTVEDLLNTVNGSKVGVLARVNAAGTGIDIVNATQETSLTISENGGATAARAPTCKSPAPTAARSASTSTDSARCGT